MNYKVEVIADSTGTWCSNQLEFKTVPEAVQYGQDLFYRWTAVRKWRVVGVEDGKVYWEDTAGGKHPME